MVLYCRPITGRIRQVFFDDDGDGSFPFRIFPQINPGVGPSQPNLIFPSSIMRDLEIFPPKVMFCKNRTSCSITSFSSKASMALFKIYMGNMGNEKRGRKNPIIPPSGTIPPRKSHPTTINGWTRRSEWRKISLPHPPLSPTIIIIIARSRVYD